MSTRNTQRIKQIAESLLSLPTLPTVVSKMIQLVDNPKTSAASLSRLISTDQALTARILKTANSAYYGFSREISTVDHAIVVVGFNGVKEMGLSLSVFDMFKKFNGATTGFDMPQFWIHSVAVGVAARLLARKFRPIRVNESFTAGLLHDVGKIIMVQYASVEFTKLMERVAAGEDFEVAEQAVLSSTHGQIGTWLADKWKLPSLIVDAIAWHHEPWNSTGDPILVSFVCIADYICHKTRTGTSGRKTIRELDPRMWELLDNNGVKIYPDSLDGLMDDFCIEFEKSQDVLSFVFDE